MNKGLLALTLGGFAIGVTEFCIMGMLEDIAAYLHITIPQAGHLISTYAIGVVVGAPTLVLFSSDIKPRKLLIILMVLYAIFNAFTALAPNYHYFLLGRFLAGLPHGAFFGVATIVAKEIAVKGKEAFSISMVFAGLTLANLLGVPFATYIGHHFVWRWVFVGIVVIIILTIISINYWVPNLPAKKDTSIKSQLNYFKTLRAWWLITTISIGTGALFAWFSYIAPLVTDGAGFSKDIVPRFMILAGFGMLVGNLLGGKLADIINPAKLVAGIALLLSSLLLIVFFTIHIPWLSVLMVFLVGSTAFTIGAPLQLMLIESGKNAEMIAAASGQASFNVGNALGAFLGGIPIALGYSIQSPQLVGASMAFIGFVLALSYWKKYASKSV